MKKYLRLCIKLGVLLAVLALAALAALRLMFPPEKIKQLTLDYAKTNLQREISFDAVSFNLIGITLTNFALSEQDSFAQGTFIQAKRLQAKAALWPLLKKRVEISTVYIDGLEVNIQKNKDGSFNFDSLLGSEETPATQPEKSTTKNSDTQALVFTAQQIKASDCDFYYKDLQTGFTTSVEDLNIQIDDFDLQRPFPAQIDFTSQTQEDNGPKVSVPVHIGLNVFLAGLELPQAYVQISQATASYRQVKLALQGKVENLEAPAVDITGSITGLDNTALTDFLPDLPYFTLPTVHLIVQAAADLENSSATIKNAALRVQDSALSANGTLGWGGETPVYNLTGKLQANIAQLVKMAQDTGFDPKGTLSGTFSATDKKDGKDVRGTLVLKDISALYPPFTLSQTNGTIKIASLDDISCAALNGLLNGEKFTSSFAYKNIKEVLDLTLRLNLDKLTLSQFPSFDTASDTETAGQPQPAAASGPETYMNINTDISVGAVNIPYFRTEGITLQTALRQVSQSMKKADGTVSFSLQPGAITDMDKLIKQSKIARIVLLPLGLLHSVGKKLNLNLFEAETQAKTGEITMTKAQGHYTFTNGLMKIDNTVFESSLTNINASGTADFTDNRLNMKASATLLTKQTPLVIKITGTMDNPSGKVDVLNTVGSVVGGILSYKTAKAAASGTVSTASHVATGAAKGTSNAATTTAKDTAKAAQATVKALGSLFKKNKDTPSE